MPGFEFDHRTGMMVQKKDDRIYFAGSMGGGLRIDDKKNNVTYVIERDGRVTNIAGIRDSKVNLYDMRDARIIADRVVRMFGRNHKYSDFHYFLKGYVMKEDVVKSYDEFVNESLFSDVVSRGEGKEIRSEDKYFKHNLDSESFEYLLGYIRQEYPELDVRDDDNEGTYIYFNDKVYFFVEFYNPSFYDDKDDVIFSLDLPMCVEDLVEDNDDWYYDGLNDKEFRAFVNSKGDETDDWTNSKIVEFIDYMEKILGM